MEQLFKKTILVLMSTVTGEPKLLLLALSHRQKTGDSRLEWKRKFRTQKSYSAIIYNIMENVQITEVRVRWS